MTAIPVTSTITINVEGVGPVELTVEEHGEGRLLLVLNGADP